MKVIRNGVFETNSSSMHSLAIMNSNNYNSEHNYSSNKVLCVYPAEYSWGYERLTEPDEKLSYLFALAASSNGLIWLDGEDIEVIDKFFALPEVKKVYDVMSEIGITINFIIDKNSDHYFGYVDHQSIETVDVFLGDISIKDFIFNEKYMAIIDNDNH